MRRHIPSTQSLVCFEAAARHESYTRAAQELSLTQSAISRQVAALEETLGIELFNRTRHGVSLTPAGAEYARQIAQRLDGIERDTQDAMTHQGTGGTLRLAVVPTFATRWLMPRLPSLVRECPDLVVHMETCTRPFLFSETGFDAAILAGTPEQLQAWPGTQATVLLHEEVIPVCSPVFLAERRRRIGAPRKVFKPRDLGFWPLLQISTRPDAWRKWFEAQGVTAEAAPHATGGPRYELFSMVAAAAIHGLGAALVPRLLVELELARGELVIACTAKASNERNYYLVTPVPHPTGAAFMSFQQWLTRTACANIDATFTP